MNGEGAQSMESMTITLVKLPSGRPRRTLSGQLTLQGAEIDRAVGTHFKMVSVCNLNADVNFDDLRV